MTTYAVQANQFVQYTGANSAAIVTLLSGPNLVVSIASETGGVLSLHLVGWGGMTNGGSDDVVHINQTDWVSAQDTWAVIISNAEFTTQWIVKA